MWETIDEFTEWYQQSNYPIRPPTTDPIYVTDHSLSSIVFREGRFQVELYMLAPNWETPTHGHPGVEHRVIYLNGDLNSTKNYEPLADSTDISDLAREDGCNVAFGSTQSFCADDWHAVKIGPKGALIAITQKWDIGLEMTSQSVHYVGPPIGPLHKDKINVPD